MKIDNDKSNNFKKSFFRNVLVSGGYNYLSQALTFFSSIIIARLLSPSNFGLVGLITVFTGFIAVFSDSGISLAVIKSDFIHSYHKSLDTLAIYMGFILFALTIILAFPISIFYDNKALIYPTIALGSTFVFRSMAIVRSALLSKALNFNYLGKVILASNVLSIFITVILAFYGFEHWAIIIPQLISSIFVVFLYEIKLRFGFDLYPQAYVQVAFKYTKKIIGSLLGFNLINYWSRSSDNLIVGKVYGISDLGIYNRAYSLLSLPLTLITGLMGTVLYPSLKKLKNEGGDIYQEYQFVLRIIGIIVFPVSLILILFPNQLVNFLWGEKWIRVSNLLPYFGLLVFSQPLMSTAGNILVLQGQEKILMFSGWISSAFILTGIIFGSTQSLLGIAQYYSLAFIICVLPFNVYYVYYRGLGFDGKALIIFWAPIIICSILIWLSCFFEFERAKLFFLCVLFLNIILTSRKELNKVYLMVLKKFNIKVQS